MLPTPLHVPSIQPTFLTTTNSAVMQRTLQTRRLYTKLSLINNKLQAEKSRLSASFVPSADNPSASYSKFNELLKKAQTPLQMNSHVKLRRTIENLTKGGGGGGGKAGGKKEEGGRREDEEEVDMDAILKNIGQICKISSYFDRIFKIDKKQKYLNIETQSYWENIDTSPEKKRILMEIYEKVHGVNQKFTFAKYQNEFERIWLNILKNITDDDKEIIFGLLNGGKTLKTDEDKQLLREFDPLKLALKLEQKLDKSKYVQHTEPLLPLSPSCSSNNRKTLASLLRTDKKQTQECACKHIHNMDVYTLKKKYKSILKVPTFLPPTKKTFANILKTLPSEKRPSEQLKENSEIKIINGLLSRNPKSNEEAEQKAFIQEKNENLQKDFVPGVVQLCKDIEIG